LCLKISKEGSDPSSIYYKNGLEVIPNPTATYSETSPIIYYYTEIYNKIDDHYKDSYRLDKVLYNNKNLPVYKDSENLELNGKSLVKVGFINSLKFPTGVYTLVINVLDAENNSYANSVKKLFIYNSTSKQTVEVSKSDDDFMSSEYGILNAEECDNLFASSIYIASSVEKDIYKSLDSLDAKRKFLYNFWKSRDLTNDTPDNEFKVDYQKRVNYANTHFGGRFKEGFKTDRGRIYILYGAPDRIDRYANQTELKPYEIWYYDSMEGGVLFIFGDPYGLSDYELLHSTKRGEVYDNSWQNRIRVK
jgi:GWxTD domain-containing protein